MEKEILVKSVLNKTKRRDPWFLDDYTLNPFSACSFNCLYCFIRGSKYGEHMEERLSVKINAVEILEKQLALRAKKKQYGIIVLSSATDPYLPIEAKYQLTRRMLELIHRYQFPVHIITKSTLLVRDFDLLQKINSDAILPEDLQSVLSNKVFVTFSFSTIDDRIAKVFEPGAPPPSNRLQILKHTREAGFQTGVSMMPMLPYITDTEEHLNMMFDIFSQLGVNYLFPASITLFGNGKADSRTLIFKAIQKHYPDLLEKYTQLFRYSPQVPTWYTNSFNVKIQKLNELHRIPSSLIQ
jgi:DNA repair photolyase